MVYRRTRRGLAATGLALLAAALISGVLADPCSGVSRFGLRKGGGQGPARIDLDEIWFYDEEGSKQIPDIHLKWIAVAFDRTAVEGAAGTFGTEVGAEALFQERAQEIVREHDVIIDAYYDPNLAEDGCFFVLRDGLDRGELKAVIETLNQEQGVAYAHPTLVLRGKVHAYFDAFEMVWKTGVPAEQRQSLLDQAHAFYDHADGIYRVKVLEIPFFRAVNLLAEDIRVRGATPYLVPLEPSIRVDLSVPLRGWQMGDRIPFTLRIDFTDRVRVDPSSLVNLKLRPGGIQKELFDIKFDPYDYVEAASRSPILITGWMKIYAPGEFVIPPVEVHYECTVCSGDAIRSIKTEAVPLKVASIVPSKGRRAKLAVPREPIPVTLPVESLRRGAKQALWEGIASLVLGVGLAGWVIRRWYGLRKEREGELGERRQDLVAHRLREHLGRASSGPDWMYAREAGMLLREYLVLRYGLEADPFLGSGRVFSHAVAGRVPGPVASVLERILVEVDDVIALEVERYPALERWKKDVLDLLDLAQSGRARAMEPSG